MKIDMSKTVATPVAAPEVAVQAAPPAPLTPEQVFAEEIAEAVRSGHKWRIHVPTQKGASPSLHVDLRNDKR